MHVAIFTENSFNSFDGILSYFEGIIPHFGKLDNNKLTIINCDLDYCENNSKITVKRKWGIKLPYFDFYLNFPNISEVDKLLNNVDIIQISGPGTMGLVGRYLAWKRKIPIVVHHHTNIDAYARVVSNIIIEKIIKIYIKIFYCGIKDIIAPTEHCAKNLEKFLRNKRFHIIKRAINHKVFCRRTNFDNFKKIKNVFESKKNGKKILLYAGRISPEKNILSMQKIYSKKIQFVFVGSGSYLNRIKKTFKTSVFIPRQTQEDLSYWYSSADIFVFPSKTDTFGNVVLESLACGTPVIAHKNTSAGEIIEDGKTGFLVDDFEQVWGKLNINKKEYNKMVKKGIQESKKYSWEKIYLQHIFLYQQILSNFSKNISRT